MDRAAGIVLPISALSSPYGIGTLGRAAREFVDFLADAGQTWWQVLPIGPTILGDSPYLSPSGFAGNPALIDFDALVEDGLLLDEELREYDWGDDLACVHYEALFVYERRLALLLQAMERGWERDQESVLAFAAEHEDWLGDYALFMAVKLHFGMTPWWTWPDEDICSHRREAVTHYRHMLADEVRLFTYVQYLFFKQWSDLRAYARARGVKIFGGTPLYMLCDSADVWAHPDYFRLGSHGVPVEAVGTPPDRLHSEGQCWDNPLYDWEAMERDGFSWWRRRMRHFCSLFDMVRIDHFRSIERTWAVPADARCGKVGHWVAGPGKAFVDVLREIAQGTPLVAQEEGEPTRASEALMRESGFLGMRVLQDAFDGDEDNENLPHNLSEHCLYYSGTHDHLPLAAWLCEADPQVLERLRRSVGADGEGDLLWAAIGQGMSSPCTLFFAQMQDYLGLGGEARMNTPGNKLDNWQWRLVPGQLTAELAGRIRDVSRLSGRVRTERS